jgi:ATP-dependent RNA helicase CshB
MLFKILNINEKLKDALSILKFVETTEIQSKTLPLLLSNKNAIIVSETGSGKTLCYLLPLFNHILENKNHCAIIITPTKELCRQIYSQILTFKQHIMELHPKLIIGGESSSNLTKNNFLNTNIIVATPNKVYELLKNKLIPVNFNEIILDEADMLFDLGFMNDINNIFTMLNKNIIKVACSATLHDAFANKLKKFFLNTEIIQNAKSI